MNKRYFQCNDIITAEGAFYSKCVVGIPEIEPTGNMALDRQTTLDNVMTALEDTLAAEVDRFTNMEELSWA